MTTTAHHEFIRELVANRSGNVISESQQYLIDARICPVAKQAGFDSLPEFVVYLQENCTSPLADTVAEALTINETSFFRDNLPFKVLRSHILPDVAKQKTVSRRLNVWSAACASGQESYSLAMTLADCPSLKDWFLQVLATDYANEMVARTREGRYSDFELGRGITTAIRDRFFVAIDGKWQVSPRLQSMVQVSRVNLTQLPAHLPDFDIIFLRNVLLYFDRETKTQILHSIRRKISDHGYLFLGGGETIIGLDVPFRSESIAGATFYRPT